MADINVILETDKIIDAKDLETISVEMDSSSVSVEAGVGEYAESRGFKKVTMTAPLTTENATPSTIAQTITSSSGIGMSSVTVAAVTASIDANIIAENIKNGVTILGVTGTYTGE